MVTAATTGFAAHEPVDQYLQGWLAYYAGDPYDMRRCLDWREGWLDGKASRSGEVAGLGGHA